MNKKTVFIIICLLFLVIALMITYILTERKKDLEQISFLPKISLEKIDGSEFNIGENESSTLLFFYKSSCYYCIEEAKQLVENISAFGCTQILFISPEDSKIISEFSKKIDCDQIEFLYDRNGVLFQRFNIKTSPTILVYSKQNEFKRRFTGIVPIEEVILEFINDK